MVPWLSIGGGGGGGAAAGGGAFAIGNRYLSPLPRRPRPRGLAARRHTNDTTPRVGDGTPLDLSSAQCGEVTFHVTSNVNERA